jgi:hypothetical protein
VDAPRPIARVFDGLGHVAVLAIATAHVLVLATTPAHTDVAASCGTVFHSNGGSPDARLAALIASVTANRTLAVFDRR